MAPSDMSLRNPEPERSMVKVQLDSPTNKLSHRKCTNENFHSNHSKKESADTDVSKSYIQVAKPKVRSLIYMQALDASPTMADTQPISDSTESEYDSKSNGSKDEKENHKLITETFLTRQLEIYEEI